MNTPTITEATITAQVVNELQSQKDYLTVRPVDTSSVLVVTNGKAESKKDFVTRCKAAGYTRGESEISFYNQLNALGSQNAMAADAHIRKAGLTVAKRFKVRTNKSGAVTQVDVSYIAPRVARIGKVASLEAQIAELQRQLKA